MPIRSLDARNCPLPGVHGGNGTGRQAVAALRVPPGAGPPARGPGRAEGARGMDYGPYWAGTARGMDYGAYWAGMARGVDYVRVSGRHGREAWTTCAYRPGMARGVDYMCVPGEQGRDASTPAALLERSWTLITSDAGELRSLWDTYWGPVAARQSRRCQPAT